MKKITARITNLLGSRRFFRFTLIFFIFEATWIALSAVYPQAFDENFHFGLIQIYSHYWLPFFSNQPPNANAYGAVARDPSYLYHYLMSFPYRFITLFIHSQIQQIIILRLLNIGLFASGLILFRRVLLRVGVSLQLTNLSLLLFVLIPVVPQLAAQINYDNLLIPLVGYVCLLTFQATDEFKKKRSSLPTLLILLSVCLLASLVQIEFLPIFLGVLIFMALITLKFFRGKFRAFGSQLMQSWRKQSRYLKIALFSLVIISIGLFTQRDVINLVKYHTVSPDCEVVLNVQDCSSYSVWSSDYVHHNQLVSKNEKVNSNPIAYVIEWSYWLWYRLFFAINGPASQYTNYPPLPLPSIAFVLIALGGVIATFKWRRRIFDDKPYIIFLAIITVLYLATLLAEGYLKYRYTGVLELMNGRYLLPILLLAAAIVGSAFSVTLRKAPQLKGLAVIVVALFFLQGGGFFTFISRSDSTWDWPNKTVVKINDTARRITNPVIVHGKKTYTTSIWLLN